MEYPDSFQLASDFINYTNRSVFLTGKAGTGKTTFLKHCKETNQKSTVVVAPTGVAAMNAGGTTIHSFFQLPFAPYLPSSEGFANNGHANGKNNLISRLHLTGERKEVMRRLELLIIDEVSMVRCDILDAIDTVLRHVRNQHATAFGGVQLLLIGDMYQLPPVVKAEEWELLSHYYKSQYFFNSHVIENNPPVFIELDKIYRQRDAAFIKVLNQVRNNEMELESFEILHSRYLPNTDPPKDEKYITLTTHNNKADAINFKELNELKGRLWNFDAMIEGEFYEKSFPADLQLKLKPGAQVMFLKNDSEKTRRYFNGKIGVVKDIDNEKISISCKGESLPIEVKKEKWNNIQYSVDKSNNQVAENEIGSFTQFPLKLAWAITIHKSQGLSFEKVVIDAGEAFAPGQVYVALSRCTSLEGMILHSRINNRSLQTDSRIAAFTQTQKKFVAQLPVLEQAKYNFQKEELKKLFDFSDLLNSAKAIETFVPTQLTSFTEGTLSWAQNLFNSALNIAMVAEKFERQMQLLLHDEKLPEQNDALQKRLAAAANHFSSELEKIKKDIDHTGVTTETKTIAADFNKLLSKLYYYVCLQLYCLNGCKDGFRLKDYLRYKKTFVQPVLPTNSYAGKSIFIKADNPHPELYMLLKKRRDELCTEKKIPLYLVAGSLTLEDMSRYLPQTTDELIMVSGFGPAKTKQFGESFLTIIHDYCIRYNLGSNISEKPLKRKRKENTRESKEDTKLVSFKLYKEGKNIAEIAAIRNLSNGTIEGHLATFVSRGEIDINTILSANKLATIRSAIEKLGDAGNKTLKEHLPAEITYGEISLVLASLQAASTDLRG